MSHGYKIQIKRARLTLSGRVLVPCEGVIIKDLSMAIQGKTSIQLEL